MRNRRTAILTALIVLALPTAVQAKTTVSSFRIKGETVEATFLSTSPDDPCLEFFVNVVASSLVEKTSPPKSKVATPRTVLFVAETDVCFDTPTFRADGESASRPLVASNLRSATLQTTVSVFDTVGLQSHDFAIDLQWTGEGPPVRENTKETFRDPDLGIVIKAHTQGVTVPASAAGTVVGLGDNFTPESSESAQIQRRKDSTLIIEKDLDLRLKASARKGIKGAWPRLAEPGPFNVCSGPACWCGISNRCGRQ